MQGKTRGTRPSRRGARRPEARETVDTPLRRYLERDAPDLLGTLRMYLVRAGLAGRDQSLDAAASELLNEVALEALQHEDRFRAAPDTEPQPRPWLLGIAANLIRRKQVDAAKRARREPLIRDLVGGDETLSDDELFDWLTTLTGAGLSELTDETSAISALLAALPPEDQRVIRLAIWGDLDGAELAAALGVSAGAARVRLHRAVKRLRARYLAAQDDVQGGAHGER